MSNCFIIIVNPFFRNVHNIPSFVIVAFSCGHDNKTSMYNLLLAFILAFNFIFPFLEKFSWKQFRPYNCPLKLLRRKRTGCCCHMKPFYVSVILFLLPWHDYENSREILKRDLCRSSLPSACYSRICHHSVILFLLQSVTSGFTMIHCNIDVCGAVIFLPTAKRK